MSTSPTLLLVTDDPLARRSLTGLLEPAGFVVVAAARSEQARHLDEGRAVVVVIELPPTSPADLASLSALREHQAGQRLPVLVLSSHDDDETIGRVLDGGADDVVRQPVRASELAARLRALVRRGEHLADRPRNSYEPYAHLLESAADGIAVISHDGRLQMANPRALDLVGVVGKKAAAVEITDFLVDDDMPLLDGLWRGFRGGVYPQGVDMRLRRVDGEVITINANFSMLKGEPVVVATFRDVTAERATSRELSKTKGFLENVIESCADGILSASESGTVRLFNRAAERCTGYAATEVVGRRRVEDLFPPGVAQQIQLMVQRRGGRLEAYRTDLLTRSGERIPVLLSSSQIVEGGVVTGTVAVFSDLRERLRMESRLVAAQEELKLRERQAIVAELAGAAAHELNQPLTSVMGYAEMLKRKLAPDAPAYAAADIILGEAARMGEIVRKLGTVARYETKSYVGQAKILDLDLASRQPPDAAPERAPATLVPPSAPTIPSSIPSNGPPTEIPPSTPENSS